MAFTPVERMQIKNAVERVLHVPGNYGGGMLEMAMVFDCNIPEDCMRQIGKDTAALLKSHSETFRNVRLNTICWAGDGKLVKEVSSIPLLQMGRCFEGYQCEKKTKCLELLTEQLKKFYARSKIIMLFTDGDYTVEDRALFQESTHPFLYRKLVVLKCRSGEEGQPDTLAVSLGAEVLRETVTREE